MFSLILCSEAECKFVIYCCCCWRWIMVVCYLALQPPSLVLMLNCVSLFVYQALDAIDGKQARRVCEATPLGELIDHGCDSVSLGETSVSVVVSSVVSSCVIRTTWRAVFMLLCWCVFSCYVCRVSAVVHRSTGMFMGGGGGCQTGVTKHMWCPGCTVNVVTVL